MTKPNLKSFLYSIIIGIFPLGNITACSYHTIKEKKQVKAGIALILTIICFSLLALYDYKDGTRVKTDSTDNIFRVFLVFYFISFIYTLFIFTPTEKLLSRKYADQTLIGFFLGLLTILPFINLILVFRYYKDESSRKRKIVNLLCIIQSLLIASIYLF